MRPVERLEAEELVEREVEVEAEVEGEGREPRQGTVPQMACCEAASQCHDENGRMVGRGDGPGTSCWTDVAAAGGVIGTMAAQEPPKLQGWGAGGA